MRGVSKEANGKNPKGQYRAKPAKQEGVTTKTYGESYEVCTVVVKLHDGKCRATRDG